MATGRRLVATFAYKAKGAIPKILYLGMDVDEAKEAMAAAIDKGYYQIKVCRDIDIFFLHRWNASAPTAAKAG
jgi:hypothetical protein